MMDAGSMDTHGRLPLASYGGLLIRYLAPLQARVTLLAVLLLGDIGLQLVNPQILRFFIDTARTGGASSTLAGAAVLFLIVVLGSQLVTSLATYLSQDVGWTATNLLRADLVWHCLRLDLSFHHVHTPGELIERVDGDVAILANFFATFVIRVLGNALLLAGILLLIVHEDWRVGLALVAHTLVALWVLRHVQGVPVPSFKAWRQAMADLSGFWEEHLAGTEDIRSCGAESYVLRRQDELLRALMHHGRAALVLRRVFQSVLEILTAVGSALAFALGAYLLTAGAMTLGTVYLIFTYTGLLTANLADLTQQLNDLQGASAAIARIRDLYAAEPRIQDGPGVAVPPGPPGITFDGVSFRYGGGPLVLHDLSVHVAPGRILGVVGRTGSGRTTLARLLARFYDPTAGTIRWGDTDVRSLQLADLRRRVGLVTQDVHVFTATVRDNLTLFGDDILDEQILQALGDLGLMEWYRRLPHGLETWIAPGGLSAGEAQLLALARVFLKDPALVILDEPSSRLDPATERLVERALDRLLEGRTGLIVAHRLATLARADDILILSDGRCVEYGPRAQLARDPTSRFARLLRTGTEEVPA
jgi:ATP-binding cassette, subfamily B, bacterial